MAKTPKTPEACIEAAEAILSPLCWNPPAIGKPVGEALRLLREAKLLMEDG